MAQQEELKIVISVDNVNALRSLKVIVQELDRFEKDGKISIDSLSQAMNAFRKAAEKSLDVEQIRKYGEGFREAQVGAQKLLNVFLGYDVIDDSLNSINRQLNDLRTKAAAATNPAEVENLGKQIQVLEGRVQSFNNTLNGVRVAKGSLEDLNNELIRLRTLAGRTTDLGALRQLGNDIRATQQRAELLNNALNGTADSSRRGRIAVYGLNQVVRDLPFGFIAISNNLPVLIDQFQELVREEKGVRGAIKSFGQALAGAGGLSIGIAAVISVITSLVQTYGSLSNVLKVLSGVQSRYILQIKEAGESLQKYNKQLKEADDLTVQQTLSVGAEIIKVEELTKILNDNTASYNEKYSALESLKNLDPERFANLRIEQGLVIGLTEAVGAYTESLILSAKAKGFETQLGAANAELSNQLFLLEDLNREVERIRRLPANIQGAAAIDRNRVLLENAISAYNEQRVVVADLEQNVQNFEVGLRDLTRQIEANLVPVREQIRLTKEQSERDKEASRLAKQRSSDAKKLADDVKKYAKEQGIANQEFALFRFLLDRPIEIVLPESNINKIIEDIRKARKELQGFKEESRPGQQNIFDISVPRTDAVQASIASVTKLIALFKQQSDAALISFQERALVAANIFNATLGPAIDSVFNAIENGQNVFEALGNSLKQLVIDIAKTIIKAAVLAAILTAISGGTFSLATFGGFFKEILASGGRIGGSGLSTRDLGGRGGVAAPNISGPGGFALAGQVVFVQRGPDLVGVLNQSNARIGRVG